MLKTLTTLLRATVADAEEVLFDANAIKLLEQRLREANAAFDAGKRDLAMVLAEEAGACRAAASLAERIARMEADAAAAIGAANTALAEDIADRIAALEDERLGHLDTRVRCADAAKRIRAGLEENARLLSELRRGLTTARAAAALERSRDRTARSKLCNEDSFREARVTLERVRTRQAQRADFDEALSTVERDLGERTYSPSGFSDRPRTDPRAILERIKSRAANPPPR